MNRRELVEGLIAKWKPRLGLGEWDIRFSDEAPDKGLGRSDIWDTKILGVMCVSPSLPDGAVERTVLHELLHFVLLYIDSTWTDRVGDYLPPPLFDSLKAAANEAEEKVIERLIRALIETPYISPTDHEDIFGRTFTGVGT